MITPGKQRHFRRIAALLVGAAILAGCAEEAGPPNGGTQIPAKGSPQASSAAKAPWPALAPGVDIHARPVEVPLEMVIPKLNVTAPMLGVGLNKDGEMDAPSAPAGDPIWQKAYWFRGSGTPGDSGTTTLSGHYTDMVGKPALLARLEDLKPGDEITVREKGGSPSVTFRVTESTVYTLEQTRDPAILARIYGPGPVSGAGPQPSPDGRAHLTLITCSGDFVNGQFNQRLVVYAERIA